MRVAVLGIGNMGKAIIAGLRRKYGDTITLYGYDSREQAAVDLPVDVRWASPREWFAPASIPDIVIVAVKPVDIAAALMPLVPMAGQSLSTLWCSIAAGVSLASLERILGSRIKICRVMPNTPALIGEGMAAFTVNGRCDDDDIGRVHHVFGACGSTVNVPERMMNAVTGLSGSGPAFVYLFIEALMEGGIQQGIPYEIARQLAIKTVRGAAGMVEETGEEPAVLKKRVMSPGGTTECGIKTLEHHTFKQGVIQAVADATKRAEELDTK